MLDTIKLGIPLSEKQFGLLQRSVYSKHHPQWGILYPDTGELVLRRTVGLAELDQESFHREIRWDIPSTYRADDTYLTVELSLPKLWYGHNIHLLYDFPAAIAKLKDLLELQFGLKGKNRFVDIAQWQVWRLDCCYAWRAPTQQVAQLLLDSLKHLHYPHKRPTIHPTSIVFVGATYSLKVYLKLPEFKAHDRRALLKAQAAIEWVDYLETIATGVLRYEATLRRKYLKRQGIYTVADLLRPLVHLEFDMDAYPEGYDFDTALHVITAYHTSETELEEHELWAQSDDGQKFTTPPDFVIYSVGDEPGQLTPHTHQGEGFTLRKRDNPTAILQYFLDKFLGENRGMQHTQEVESLLTAAYKPVKAARLMAMWLYVQRLGTVKAKEAFGHDSYYRAKREMKSAGVSLVEPPKNVIRLEPKFSSQFKFEVPSEYVTNKFDDFRDSGNLLNFVPQASNNN